MKKWIHKNTDPNIYKDISELIQLLLEDKKMDNWANKTTLCCETCQYFVRKETVFSINKEVGRCRRNAPSRSGYPVVYLTDFCGEHKLGNRPNEKDKK